MAKVFNSFEKIAIKNAAKAIAAIQTKQEKLRKCIETLEAQIAAHNEEIKVFEDSVKGITGGYSPTELCRKEQRENGKQADWVFVYPDTIIPPVTDECPMEHPETEKEAEEVNWKLPKEETPENNFLENENGPAWQEEPDPDPMDDIFKD